MPAITGAGNSPVCLYHTSFPAGLTATESRRLGRFKHLLFSFCRKTERNRCWEAAASLRAVELEMVQCSSSESLAEFEEWLKAKQGLAI